MTGKDRAGKARRGWVRRGTVGLGKAWQGIPWDVKQIGQRLRRMAQKMSEKFKQELLRNQYDIVRWAEQNIQIKRPDERGIGPLVLGRRQKDWLRTATRRGGDGRGPLVHSVAVASWP